MRSTLVALIIVASVGCGGTQDGTSPPAQASAGAAGAGGSAGSSGSAAGQAGNGGSPGAPSVAWAPCPLFSDGTGPEAQCAELQVPLRATDPTGATIPMFVKRYRSATVEPTAQFIMLSGGPGAAATIYEKLTESLVAKDPTLEVYLPDHRGTGRSARLGCPDEEADGSLQTFYVAPTEWPTCVDAIKKTWGDKLDAFNTTNAANDLGVLIDRVRRPGVKSIVYGASYGTSWAERYLQLHPSQADGVILDAIVPPGGSLARQDQDADEAAKKMFDACAKDAGCQKRLGDDPRARALALYDKLDLGHCKKLGLYGPPRTIVRRMLGQMMMNEETAHLIPAVIARAERCEPQDTKALLYLEWYFYGRSGGTFGEVSVRQWGWYLSAQITFSEMWEAPSPTKEVLAEWRAPLAVSRDVTTGFDGSLEVVPRYAKDAYVGAYATTDTPMLMLQGDWDPATLSAKAQIVKTHFHGPYQTWVDIPGGGHGALGHQRNAAGASCGTSMILQFVADPKQPIDSSCLADAVPLSFDGSPALNKTLFGTEDLWGGL